MLMNCSSIWEKTFTVPSRVSRCACVHTHSWPSHSCVRASSGCRSDAHPGRRVSPALWIPPWVLPSVSRTASHSCIAPLQRKTHTHTQKHWGQRSTILRHNGNRCPTWFVFSQEEASQASHSSQSRQQLMRCRVQTATEMLLCEHTELLFCWALTCAWKQLTSRRGRQS